jgi:hypothetical protein
MEIAGAVEAAHEQGIIRRDLKPANRVVAVSQWEGLIGQRDPKGGAAGFLTPRWRRRRKRPGA